MVAEHEREVEPERKVVNLRHDYGKSREEGSQ